MGGGVLSTTLSLFPKNDTSSPRTLEPTTMIEDQQGTEHINTA